MKKPSKKRKPKRNAGNGRLHELVSPQAPEPVSTEPLQRMAEDMQAIWLLCETRSKYGLEAARKMLRRISFNDAMMCHTALEQELRTKPILERRILPAD